MFDLIRLRGILDQICVAGDMGVNVVVDTDDVALSVFELWGGDGHCVFDEGYGAW